MVKDFIRRIRIILIRVISLFRPNIQLPETAIIVAPHPDDEVFGCCGLMTRMLSEGKNVELVIMTGGGKSHRGCCDIPEDELIFKRRKLTLDAAAIYSLSSEHIHFLDYSDGEISEDNTEQTNKLTNLLKQFSEDKVVSFYYPHRIAEGWSDHIATSRIVSNIINKYLPKAVQYEYCVWFWFYNFWRMDWKNARKFRMNSNEHIIKIKAIETYIRPKASCGKPYSGVLPKVFTWANSWNKELYLKVK